MKADFMTQLPRVSQLEEAALLPQGEIAERIRAELPNASRDPRCEQATSFRLQAESFRALARYERTRTDSIFVCPLERTGYVQFLNDQAAVCDTKAAKVEHEIATGAK